MGAVGLPEFDHAPPEKRPEKGLLGLREALGVYANLRLCWILRPTRARKSSAFPAWPSTWSGRAARGLRVDKLRANG